MQMLSTPRATCYEQRLPAKSRVHTNSYVWQIHEYTQSSFRTIPLVLFTSRHHKTVSGLQSTQFTFSLIGNEKEGFTDTTCYLMLTRDPAEGNEEQLSPWLRLSLVSKEPCFREIECQSLRNDSRNVCFAWIVGSRILNRSRLTGGFQHTEYVATRLCFTNPKFVLYEDLFDKDKGLVINDTITIVCEVHTYTNDITCVDSWLFQPTKSEVSQNIGHTLAKDLKRMLDTGQGSDVTLVTCDGQEFPAHVSILSSRSPVFAAMFEHDMKEKQDKRVVIKDFPSNAVEGLLEFIYTDNISNISTLAQELLPAAHKYDVCRLKMLCEEAMSLKLNIYNAATFFCLADLHQASLLRSEAKQLILTQFYDAKKTDGWKQLQNRCPQLAEEVVDELAELMRQLTSTSV